jgi:hypothetical protein
MNAFAAGLAAVEALAETACQVAEEEDAKQSDTRDLFLSILTPLHGSFRRPKRTRKA